jgi:L-aminopeptidase/D-esterase-like protein
VSEQKGPHLLTPSGKPRARAVGLRYQGVPGPHNAITDVPGVEVGYQTLIEGDDVRTGVTVIHPRGKDNPGDPLAAGYFSFNGNGEMTGVSWIEESGTMQGPVAITNTYAVGVAHAGIIAWLNQAHPELTDVWLLPVAAETWDLLQANFGRRDELVLNGVYLGEALKDDNPMAGRPRQAPPGAGSVIVIVMTDAPLFPSHRSPALPRGRLAEILATPRPLWPRTAPLGHLLVDICRYNRLPSLTLRPCLCGGWERVQCGRQRRFPALGGSVPSTP